MKQSPHFYRLLQLRFFASALGAFIGALSLALFSCSALSISETETCASKHYAATLSVSCLDESRAALPEAETADFTSLVLTGSLDGKASETLGSWSSYHAMAISAVGLDTGSWTFTLTATTGALVYTGETSLTVSSGENAVSFSLTLSSITFTGSGAVSVTLTLPQTVTSVTAGLYQTDGTTVVSGYEAESLTVTSGDSTNSVTYAKSDVPSGTYIVVFSLYGDDSVYVGPWREYASITEGYTSTATQTVNSVDSIYSITYELDGGVMSGTYSGSYSRWSDDIALPESSAVSRENAVFLYWYELDASGSEVVVTQIDSGSTGDRTMYAKWRYTALYVSESGSDDNSGSTLENAKATLQAALSAFDASDYACTVYVSGTVSGVTTIDSSVACASLTLCGYTTALEEDPWLYTRSDWSDVLDGDAGGSVLSVSDDCALSVTVQYLRLQNGSAENGAGIDMQGSGTLTLLYAAVCENTASACGGGINAASGTVSLTNVCVESNSIVASSGTTALYGAGIAISGSAVTVTGCNIGNNSLNGIGDGTCVGYGQCISITSGSLTFVSEAEYNSNNMWGWDWSYLANMYGGIYVGGGTCTVSGSLYGDFYLADGQYITVGGSVTNLGIWLMPQTYAAGTQVLGGTSALVAANYTQFSVSNDSEGGSWGITSDGTLISTSLYVAGSGASSDLGSASDAGAGSKSSPLATVQAAIDLANVNGWKTCTIFVSGTVSGNTSISSSVDISNIDIRSYSGSDYVYSATLSGSATAPVLTASGSSSLTVQGMTITGGAGGIAISGACSANIWSCTITENSGSGISLTGSGWEYIFGCTISDNTATNGAALSVTGNCFAYVSGCTISDNSASAAGGAIYCAYTGSDSSSVQIAYCTLTDNSAVHGGAISVASGSLSVYGGNGDVSGNSASSHGNGVYVADGAAFSMGGDAAFASSDDVYLETGSMITITDTLSGDSPVAVITPASYTAGIQVLTASDDELISENYSCFEVTQEDDESEWAVTSAGLLKNNVTVYTITYNYNGGELAAGETETTSFTEKKMVTLPLAAKDGCIFAGWYTKEDFSGDYVTEIAAGTTADVVLYARWIKPALYVSEDGSDDNDGLSAATALATLAKAVGTVSDGDCVLNTLVSDYGSLNTINGINNAASLDWTVYITGTVNGCTNISWPNAASITLTGATGLDSSGVPQDALDGESADSVLTIWYVPVTITNLAVQHGSAERGGGLNLCSYTQVTLGDGALVTENTASVNGGGVHIEGGSTLVMTGGTVSANSASECGGGIHIAGSLTMSGGSVSANTAGIYGSGIYAGSTFEIFAAATVAFDNDVYLPYGCQIWISDTLTGTAPVATITPDSYTAGTYLLSAGDSSIVAANYSKFAVTPDGSSPAWGIDSYGRLQQFQEWTITIDIASSTEYSNVDLHLGYTADSTSVTFTADSGYSSYTWAIDGSSETTSSESYTIELSSLGTGNHTLLLVVTDASGEVYSATCTFTVSSSD